MEHSLAAVRGEPRMRWGPCTPERAPTRRGVAARWERGWCAAPVPRWPRRVGPNLRGARIWARRRPHRERAHREPARRHPARPAHGLRRPLRPRPRPRAQHRRAPDGRARRTGHRRLRRPRRPLRRRKGRRELTWHQPWQLYYLAILCSMAAAVEGASALLSITAGGFPQQMAASPHGPAPDANGLPRRWTGRRSTAQTSSSPRSSAPTRAHATRTRARTSGSSASSTAHPTYARAAPAAPLADHGHVADPPHIRGLNWRLMLASVRPARAPPLTLRAAGRHPRSEPDGPRLLLPREPAVAHGPRPLQQGLREPPAPAAHAHPGRARPLLCVPRPPGGMPADAPTQTSTACSRSRRSARPGAACSASCSRCRGTGARRSRRGASCSFCGINRIAYSSTNVPAQPGLTNVQARRGASGVRHVRAAQPPAHDVPAHGGVHAAHGLRVLHPRGHGPSRSGSICSRWRTAPRRTRSACATSGARPGCARPSRTAELR